MTKTWNPNKRWKKGSFKRRDWKALMLVWWAAEHFISEEAAAKEIKKLSSEEKKILQHRIKNICAGNLETKAKGDYTSRLSHGEKAVFEKCVYWKKHGSPGQPISKYEIRGLDVWGNDEDGYEVNNSWNLGTISINDDADDKEIVHRLTLEGYLPRGSSLKTINVRSEIDFIEILHAGEPVLHLYRKER